MVGCGGYKGCDCLGEVHGGLFVFPVAFYLGYERLTWVGGEEGVHGCEDLFEA